MLQELEWDLAIMAEHDDGLQGAIIGESSFVADILAYLSILDSSVTVQTASVEEALEKLDKNEPKEAEVKNGNDPTYH